MGRTFLAVIALLAIGATAGLAQTFRPINQTPVCGPRTDPAAPGNPDRYRPGLPPGTDLVKVELRSPDAICNDGSRAVIYVRRATAGARDPQGPVANKWVFEFKGGGACGGFDGCIERWCGVGGYDPSVMSTRWTPDTIGGSGIHLRDPRNHFGDWNQVYAYYCSSDSWAGRKPDSPLIDPDDRSRGYTVHFMGSRIVDAIIDQLEQGATDRAGAPLLPRLTDATEILFAGWSAGGGGPRNNADRISGRLKARNANLKFWAAVDAGIIPDEAGLSGLPPGNPMDPYTQTASTFYQEVSIGAHNALLDESCLEFHRAGGTQFLCADPAHVSRHHLTTPAFQRQDYMDPLALQRVNRTYFPTVAAAAQGMWDNMNLLRNMLTNAEEARNMTNAPGLIGNLCGDHVAMQNNDGFHAPRVRSPATSQAYTFHELLSNWYFGRQPVAELGARPPSSPATPVKDPLCSASIPTGGPPPPPTFSTVSSASFDRGEPVAPESIVAGFGTGLAASTALATSLPLPTELGGTRVNVTDSRGVTRAAPLFFVSPQQINYLAPPGTATGTARVSVTPASGPAVNGTVEVAPVAPGLYAANAQGTGVAAGLFVRVALDGTQTQGLLYDPATSLAVPVDLGRPGERVFLVLFGTGLRGVTRGATASVGGIVVSVLGPVPQGQFAGLDQFNLELPRRLAGRGEVEIGFRVDEIPANAVTVNIR